MTEQTLTQHDFSGVTAVRILRFRFTIRRMMVAVAIAAIICAATKLGIWVYRLPLQIEADHFRRKASEQTDPIQKAVYSKHADYFDRLLGQ